MCCQILPTLATNFHVNILAKPMLINPSLFQKFSAEENLVCNTYDVTYIYFKVVNIYLHGHKNLRKSEKSHKSLRKSSTLALYIKMRP